MNNRKSRISCLTLLSLIAIGAHAQNPESEASAEDVSANAAGTTTEGAAVETVPTIPVDAPEAAEAEEGSPKSRNRMVEEIVVTAQKREENLQEVPVTIAAFSPEALDARGAFDVKALANITPALSITEFGGYSYVYIRGVGTDVFVPSADPSVTTYIDGIYVPNAQGMVTDFGGIERVEVLKGPQGTLFGRNSTGGAISVITKKPGDSFESSLQTQVGNYNERRVKGYVSVPLADSFGASADVLYKKFDSQYVHLTRDLPDEKSIAGRVRVNWHPTDNFDIDAFYFKSEQDGTGSFVANNIHVSPVGRASGVPEAPDDYIGRTDYPAYVDGYYEVKSVSSKWELPWFDIKLQGSDQLNLTRYTAYDFDGSAMPLIGFNAPNQFTDAQHAELLFASNKVGWGGDSFDWVVGTYFVQSKAGYRPLNLQVASTATDAITPFLPAGLRDQFSSVFRPATETNVALQGILGTRSLSGFAQGTWHTTEWLDLTLGARYQQEDRYLVRSDTSFDYPLLNINQEVLQFPLEEDNNRTNLTTRANISVKPGEDSLFYLSRAEGFKSANYNIASIYTAPNFIKPETVVAYELGMKKDFFDGVLRFNAALFDTKIKNKQTGIVSLIAGGAVRLDNAEKASVRGAEFDLLLTPFPNWNPGMVLTANGAYLDAKYDKYTMADGFDRETERYREDNDFSGAKIERTPEFSGGLGVVQNFEAGQRGEVEVGADAYYNDGFFYSPNNTDIHREDSYLLVSARVSYLYRPWDVRMTMFGKNLTNENYRTGEFQTDYGILSNRAYPVQYGLRLDWNF